MLKRLYNWVLHWAHTPYGAPALFILAFAESSFFPIPPDVLLIALSLSLPQKAFRFALICSVASVLGGIAGYLIGWGIWENVKDVFLALPGFAESFNKVAALDQDAFFWIVFSAGFTIIPYKVITISAGVFHGKIEFWVFVLASAISRSARFFLVAGLIYKYGKPIGQFIDKYFNWLSIGFIILLVSTYLLIKYLI